MASADFLTRLRFKARKRRERVVREQSRAYQPGAAAIDPSHIYYGVDTSEYAPEKYGDYLRTSNLIYSVVSQRAMNIQSLPLRIYKPSDRVVTPFTLVRELDTMVVDLFNEVERISGIRHTKRNAMQRRHAIQTLARSHSELSLATNQRALGLTEVTEGDAVDLLSHVNPFWTLNKLMMMTSMSMDTWGQSYWFMDDTGSGRPKEIWWAKPTQVYPLVHNEKYIVGYAYEPINGGELIPFTISEALRIMKPDPQDEFQPLPPLAASRLAADHESASMVANINLHNNGLNIAAVVTPKADLIWAEDVALEVEEDMNRRWSGKDKAHRWGVFRHDVNINTVGIAPKDAQFIDGMGYDVESVARAYHWPIDLLGGKRTYENYRQAQLHAWQTTMLESIYLAAEITEMLLPLLSDDQLIASFDLSHISVLQEAETERWEREMDMIHLAITVNEWRASRALPPMNGGDILYINNQFTPLEMPVFITSDLDQDENFEDRPPSEQPVEPKKVPVKLNGAVKNGKSPDQ